MLVDVRWVILLTVALTIFAITKRDKALVAPIATSATVVGVAFLLLRLGLRLSPRLR
jgi:hypothetical protein